MTIKEQNRLGAAIRHTEWSRDLLGLAKIRAQNAHEMEKGLILESLYDDLENILITLKGLVDASDDRC